jgi:hypothetical protein
LDSNTPKFHGNANEDVDDWLYKIQINFRLASLPEKFYVDYLTNYRLGRAGIFLRRLRDSYKKKFENLSLQKESFNGIGRLIMSVRFEIVLLL